MLGFLNFQLHCRANSQDNLEGRYLVLQDETRSGDDSPNAMSESLLKCLLNIFLRMGSSRMRLSMEKFPTLSSREETKKSELQDPYCIWPDFEKRDIGPYRNFCSIDARSINQSRTSSSLFLIRRLK